MGSSLSLSLSLSLAMVLPGQQGPGNPQRAGVPGNLPGTERWLVRLRTPSFNRAQLLAQVRAQPTRAGRLARIQALRQLAQNDQAAIALAVASVGGAVEQHYWMQDLVAIEVPNSALPLLRALPRVVRVTPIRAYALADAGAMGHRECAPNPTPPPIGTSTDPLNHNVAAAWALLANQQGVPYKGAGARVAVFDTGIDRDIDGRSTSPGDQPHPSFAVVGGTRVEAFLQAQNANHVDVNTINRSVSPPFCGGAGPFGFSATRHHSLCGHGTAMSAIIAGSQYGNIDNGHAPAAVLIDVACSSMAPATPQFPVVTAGRAWEVTDAGILSAIEQLREYILLQGVDGYLQVVNLSIGGDPDPFNEATAALDSLARDEDVLLVVSAGNDYDTTVSSLGCYHAIAVGGVHARTSASPANFAFVPMLQTSRGPLASNSRRFYPDVCATGAGPGSIVGAQREFRYPYSWSSAVAVEASLLMPGIDLNDPAAISPANDVTPLRYRLGTSEAAAQVSGAAALYRGYRLSIGEPTTAEETRAVLLLNVIGTFTDGVGATSDPTLQHAYSDRNTFGVGYVRDDLVAQFAKRDPAIRPLAAMLGILPDQLSSSVTYGDPSTMTPLTPGKRYAVVACWRRYYDDSDGAPPERELPDVDLDVLDQGVLIARSATPANSYERLVFVAPVSGQVTVRAMLKPNGQYPVPVYVQIVARLLPDDLDSQTVVSDVVHAGTGSAEPISAGATCTAIAGATDVLSVIPTNYSDAYGSDAFSLDYDPSTPSTWVKHRGFAGSGWDMAAGGGAHIRLLSQSEVLPQVPHVIGGLAFRSWRPLRVDGDAAITITIEERNGLHNGTDGSDMRTGPASGGIDVLRTYTCNLTLRNPGPQVPGGYPQFSVLAPFPVPFAWSGKNLHFWISGPGIAGIEFRVDSINDGWSASFPHGTTMTFGPVATYAEDPVGTLQRREYVSEYKVPIIGLLGPSTLSARAPLLEAMGSMWTGQGVHVRLTRAPANTGVALYFGGFRASPLPISPYCQFLLDGSAGSIFGATSSSGIGEFQISIPPGLVHYHFGLQALLLTAQPVTSNALRVTIGGAL